MLALTVLSRLGTGSSQCLIGEYVNEFTVNDFEKLALPLLNRLYGFARSLSGNPDEASDLVQESLTRALHRFGSFREGTNFDAWIFTILRNIFLNTCVSRTKRNEPLEEHEEDVASANDNPEKVLLRHADTELVQRAIAKLPEEFRHVLLLVDIHEMRYRDVAQHLGIPRGTVMSRLARARKKLRDHLICMLQQQRELGVRQARHL